MVGLVVQGVEHRHDRVAGEPFDQAALSFDDDRHGAFPVRVDHLDHVLGRPALREAREPLQVGEEHRHVLLAAAEPREVRLLRQSVRQPGADVSAEQRVHPRELSGGSLQHRDLVGAEALVPQTLEQRRERLVLPDRDDQLTQRLRLPAVDPLQRPLQVQAAERRRHRPLATVLGAGRQEDRAERDRHQDVPFPPRRVPAMAEHDRDHRLGQEDEGREDGERQRPFPLPIQLQVADGGERVEADGDGREQAQEGRRLLARRMLQDLDLAERRDRPRQDQHAEPQPDRRGASSSTGPARPRAGTRKPPRTPRRAPTRSGSRSGTRRSALPRRRRGWRGRAARGTPRSRAARATP